VVVNKTLRSQASLAKRKPFQLSHLTKESYRLKIVYAYPFETNCDTIMEKSWFEWMSFTHYLLI
jgi:hypothetical protein